MRNAFNRENGPPTDPKSERAERQALGDLHAGAIGAYKNSNSHRRVPTSDPTEVFEMIMLANHLLRIIDARSPISP